MADRRLVPLALAPALLLAGCVGTPPEDLVCTATVEGNLLEWSSVENATGYRIYRNVEGDIGNATRIAEVNETTFLDTNVTADISYQYHVTTVTEAGESFPRSCTVTAVPFFPGIAVGAIAVVGGVAAYVALRRKS